jgi:hypothetical protein
MLILLWILGIISGIGGELIHLFLILAIVIWVIDIITGERPV